LLTDVEHVRSEWYEDNAWNTGVEELRQRREAVVIHSSLSPEFFRLKLKNTKAVLLYISNVFFLMYI
jgi:hypothetical protein